MLNRTNCLKCENVREYLGKRKLSVDSKFYWHIFKEKLQGIKLMRNKEEYNIIKGGEKGVR